MIIITSKYLVPKDYAAIALFPFLLLRHKSYSKNKVLINHEKIHLRQQAELLIIPFYIWYLAEYFMLLIKLRDKKMAYRNISFENEAYIHESDFEYLSKRPLWNFRNYIFSQK